MSAIASFDQPFPASVSKKRMWPMVEQIRRNPGQALQLLCAIIAAATGSAALIGYFTGWLATGTTNAHDMQRVQTQYDSLTTQISVQAAQTALQMRELSTKLDERTGSYDVRLRQLEMAQAVASLEIKSAQMSISAVLAEIKAIDTASRAQLPMRR